MIDFHCDTFLKMYIDKSELKTNKHHIDIEKMIKGGAMAQIFASFIHMESVDAPKKYCADMLAYGKKELLKNKDKIDIVTTYKEYESAIANKKMAAILGIEEGGALEGKMENLDYFYNEGIRLITLTWNFPNEIGFPNADYTHKDKGLTPFGLELIKEMNQRGMIIDVSHLSDGGFHDCIKHSTAPIVASHSNARAVCEHTRNLTDDMLKLLANNGGITGINYLSYFLDGTDFSKVDSMVKHIEHIKTVAGIDTLALGSDFDGIGCGLEIEDIGQMDKLKNALNAKGFSCEEIDKIFFKNGERVLRDTLK